MANKKALHSITATDSSLTSGKSNQVAASCDFTRYEYFRTKTGDYLVPDLTANVTMVISDDDVLQEGSLLKNGSEVSVVLDETNCWSSQKGDTDRGTLLLIGQSGETVGRVEFTNVTRLGNQILHTGTFTCSR